MQGSFVGRSSPSLHPAQQSWIGQRSDYGAMPEDPILKQDAKPPRVGRLEACESYAEPHLEFVESFLQSKR